MTIITNLSTEELVQYCAGSHDAFVRKAGERLKEMEAELDVATTKIDRLEWDNKGIAEWRAERNYWIARASAVVLDCDQLRAELDAAQERINEFDGLLSRVLHELAGAASLCWWPNPSGVFNAERAIGFVEAAIDELRAALRGKA